MYWNLQQNLRESNMRIDDVVLGLSRLIIIIVW